MALGEYLGAGPTVTKGLYHLNGDANDSSGNGNNGTPTNITWVGGKLGSGAASFNGTSSGINLGNTASLNLAYNTTYTISGWCKFASGSFNIIVAKEQAQVQYRLLVYEGQAAFGVGTGILTKRGPNLYDGKWHNVIGVCSGSSALIYVDGVYVGAGDYGTDSSSTNVYIGRRTSGLYASGLIDEVIIENVAWTASQIKKYYTYTKGRFGIT